MNSGIYSSIIKLNVGGHYFPTSLQTLTKDPNSVLAATFSGKFETRPSEDGAFFIDRDGTHFRFILNYLRTGKLTLPDEATILREVEEEADFYQIQGIVHELKGPGPFGSSFQVKKAPEPFQESKILTSVEHRQVLQAWLPPLHGTWIPLFQASRDGSSSESFHSKCDNKGPTVTIVNSVNSIFGGFTDVSWMSGRVTWVTQTKAFLFSMVNPQGLGPTKMPIKKSHLTGFYSDSGLGPKFGGQRDLEIISAVDEGIISGFSHLGRSFDTPPGQQATFLTGKKTFKVTDYEVFGLHE